MCYFRGSSLKTVPPACNLARHCLLFQSVAHFPEVLLTFSKINKVRYFYQTFLFQIFNYTNSILNHYSTIQYFQSSIFVSYLLIIINVLLNLHRSFLLSMQVQYLILSCILSGLHHRDVLQLLHKRLIHLL